MINFHLEKVKKKKTYILFTSARPIFKAMANNKTTFFFVYEYIAFYVSNT